MAIWVTSDLHLNHKNILTHCRPEFSDIHTHDQYIIDQFNSVVQPDDLVYILGDLGFTPQKQLTELVKKLNGRKILLIGNHDTLKDGDYQQMGFIQVIRHPIYYSENIILSHFPLKEAENNPWITNIHGHLHKSLLDNSHYYNVNCELHEYRPLNLKELAAQLSTTLKSDRYEEYGTEWYHIYEKNIVS